MVISGQVRVGVAPGPFSKQYTLGGITSLSPLPVERAFQLEPLRQVGVWRMSTLQRVVKVVRPGLPGCRP